MKKQDNEKIQRMCREYLGRLQHLADKHGLGFWLRDIIRENKRGACEATRYEVRMLSRMVDDERLKRDEIPDIMGKSYRQCVDDGTFDRIEKLPRQGIYSKLSTLLLGNKIRK